MALGGRALPERGFSVTSSDCERLPEGRDATGAELGLIEERLGDILGVCC